MVTGRYEYRDEQGKLAYWKERQEPGRNGRKKEFRFYHGQRESGRGGETIIYNLPQVKRAKFIIVTEGEKQADLVNRWRIKYLAATTLDSGSSGRFPVSMTEAFRGKRVAILQDNDAPGLTYAQNIADAVHDVAESVKIVLLPGLPEKGDICDWRGTAEECLSIIKAASEYVPPPKPEPVKHWHEQPRREGGEDVAVAKAYPVDQLLEFKGEFTECLWHEEKTGSLHHNKRKNRVKCFGCGKSADAIEVAMKLYEIPFKDAVRRLTGF